MHMFLCFFTCVFVFMFLCAKHVGISFLLTVASTCIHVPVSAKGMCLWYKTRWKMAGCGLHVSVPKKVDLCQLPLSRTWYVIFAVSAFSGYMCS